MLDILDPVGPATSFIALGLNQSVIQVEWEPPLHPNGIVGYKLYQWASLPVNASAENGSLIYDGDRQDYFIFNLPSNTTLYFQIIPYNIKYNLIGNKSRIISGINSVSGIIFG